MRYRLWRRALAGLLGLLLVSGPAFAAEEASVRQCLAEAATAASAILQSGDQSAARRCIALLLAEVDPPGAADMVAGMRRPSDAARALGAVACALSQEDTEAAREAAATAGRLLSRIAGAQRRDAELRLLLTEIACLGEHALAAAPELSPQEARHIVVLARASVDANGALALLHKWNLGAAAADRARAAVARQLAESNAAQALQLAAQITSTRIGEGTLWYIATQRPPTEAMRIGQIVQDPVIRSAIIAEAMERLALDGVVSPTIAPEVIVDPASAVAQTAAALAAADEGRAVELARSLPERARAWALARIAVTLAASKPERAEGLLAELKPDPEIVRLVAARMAGRDSQRAVALARSLPEREARDAALAAIAAALAGSDAAQSADLVWEIATPQWRTRAAAAVARRLAERDTEAATSLLGLVPDAADAQRIRAEIAALLGSREVQTAERLLCSLPQSDYRSEAALEAARRALEAGRLAEEAVGLAEIGLERDLALRWLIPALASSQTESPISLSESITRPYLRTLSLVDLARAMLGRESKCRPAPGRARQIRPVVGWEGV